MSSKQRKSWRERLADSKGLPKVERITAKMSKRWGEGIVVIPAPKDVDEVMRGVPKGKLITINEIRKTLARRHSATIACPITTGIFVCISARAAEEALAEGKKRITPYWRTLRSGGELNEKYPGGLQAHSERLKAEGHIIEPGKGKRPPKVKDFNRYLVKV